MEKTGKKNNKNPKSGIFSFLLRVINYVKKYILGVYRAKIFELELEHLGPKIVSDLNPSFKLATKSDILTMYKEHYDYDKKKKRHFIGRLEKGDRCILALHNGKIIGYLWVTKDQMELRPNKYIFLSKNRSCSYKGFVLKEYRGRRIHGAMYGYLIDLLKKDGKRFVISIVDMDNKSSLRSKSRDGYNTIGRVTHLRFFGLKFEYIKKKELSYLQNQ